MQDNVKVSYNITSGVPTLRKSSLMDDVLISRDGSVVRFYREVVDGHIFSPVIFLSEESYETWNNKYEKESSKKSAMLSTIRDRFLKGLDVLDEYFAHQELSIEDKSDVAKIRNHVVNVNPALITTTQQTEIDYINESGFKLKSIVGGGVSDEVFFEITQGYFLPEVITSKMKGYHLRLFPEIKEVDEEVVKLDRSFTVPESTMTESRSFNNISDYKEFESKIDLFDNQLAKLVSKKIEILKVLLEKGLFKDELHEITGYQDKIPPTKEIVDIINDRYKVCSVCNSKTSTSFCSNIECKTVLLPTYNYQISEDKIMDYFLSSAVKIDIETDSLISTSNRDKKLSILNSGKRFINETNEFLDENPTSLCINYVNTNKSRNPKDDLDGNLCKDDTKVAVMDSGDSEMRGLSIHFWDYFENKGVIYAIIQTEREIKTPSLVKAVRDFRKSVGSSKQVDQGSDYYDNLVFYVEADVFGQIKSIGEGVLYTDNESKIRLKKGTGRYDKIISLKKPKFRPSIDDILFFQDESCVLKEREGQNIDVERIFNELSHSDATQSSTDSDIYRYSRRYFYPPEMGYFICNIKDDIYKVSSCGGMEYLGVGSINKFEFVTLHDSIRWKEYQSASWNSWIFKIVRVYFGNLVSPNKGSEKFLADYDVSSNTRFSKTLDESNKPASLLSSLINLSKTPPVYLRKDSIATGAFPDKKEYSTRHLSVFNIKEVSPFLMQELKSNDLIEKIELFINNNQSEVRNGKLNILEETSDLFPSRISFYVPSYINDSVNKLTSKHLIQNGLRGASSVDDFTISLNISLNKGTSLYEMTLLQRYLEENGLLTMSRVEENTPIPVRTNDLLSLIL